MKEKIRSLNQAAKLTGLAPRKILDLMLSNEIRSFWNPIFDNNKEIFAALNITSLTNKIAPEKILFGFDLCKADLDDLYYYPSFDHFLKQHKIAQKQGWSSPSPIKPLEDFYVDIEDITGQMYLDSMVGVTTAKDGITVCPDFRTISYSGKTYELTELSAHLFKELWIAYLHFKPQKVSHQRLKYIWASHTEDSNKNFNISKLLGNHKKGPWPDLVKKSSTNFYYIQP